MSMDGSFHLLFRPPDAVPGVNRRVFAIGKFDGLHIAHQAVLERAVSVAGNMDAEPCLFTFTPHPRFALTGDPIYERLLTPLGERARTARAYGMMDVFVAQFDAPFRAQTAEEFIGSYLLSLRAVHLVVGYDFRFGHRGAFGPDDLARIGRELQITVDTIAHAANDAFNPLEWFKGTPRPFPTEQVHHHNIYLDGKKIAEHVSRTIVGRHTHPTGATFSNGSIFPATSGHGG